MRENKEIKYWYTLTELSEITGMNRQTLYRLIWDKKIKLPMFSDLRNNKYRIPASVVEECKEKESIMPFLERYKISDAK